MSNAIKKLHDYLAMSPSVVYPEDVLAYLPAIEDENAKLRELLEAVLQCAGETKRDKGCDACPMYNGQLCNDGVWCLLRSTLRELGVDE